MNNLRIYIIILLSIGLLASCSVSHISSKSEFQQITKDEAKEALIGLVKSKPNIFPGSVFKDPKDNSTLNICFTESGYYSTGCVLVHLNERTYEIMENFEWGNEFETYYWKGAFIHTTFNWNATIPIEWKEWGEFKEVIGSHE